MNALHVDDTLILKTNRNTDTGNKTGRKTVFEKGDGYKPLYKSTSVATGTGSFITNTWEGE